MENLYRTHAHTHTTIQKLSGSNLIFRLTEIEMNSCSTDNNLFGTVRNKFLD